MSELCKCADECNWTAEQMSAAHHPNCKPEWRGDAVGGKSLSRAGGAIDRLHYIPCGFIFTSTGDAICGPSPTATASLPDNDCHKMLADCVAAGSDDAYLTDTPDAAFDARVSQYLMSEEGERVLATVLQRILWQNGRESRALRDALRER